MDFRIIAVGVVIFLIILFVALSPSSSTSSNSASSNSASNSGDPCKGTCTANQTCSSGTCVNNLPPGCGSGPACSTGTTCVSGACIDSSTICSPACSSSQSCVNNACVSNNANCTSNSDCSSIPNQMCNTTNGTCENIVCAADSDCTTAGYFCSNQTCTKDNCPNMSPASGKGQGCYHSQYVSDCTVSPNACGTEYSCDGKTKLCIPNTCTVSTDCLNTELYNCVNGKCQSTSCDSSTPCGPGEYCSNNVCKVVQACTTTCPSSTDTCYNGMCVPTCNYLEPNSCGVGLYCIPQATGNAFNATYSNGICLQDGGDDMTYTLPNNISCASNSDCPSNAWECTNKVCQLIEPNVGDACADGSTVAPGFNCTNGKIAANNFKNCVYWQGVNPESIKTCTKTTWSASELVDAACLGSMPGLHIAKTTDGTQYNTTPVAFKLGGTQTDGTMCPNYPLFGFFNSNGGSQPGFTTYDLGDWLTFGPDGAVNNNAAQSKYKNCAVVEAAYLAKSASCASSVPFHIPAWQSNSTESLLTYKGVPLCYNVAAGGSIAPVNASANAPSSFTQMSAGNCKIPSDDWGNGTLEMYPVWQSDGINVAT